MITVDDLLSRRNQLDSFSLTNDIRGSVDAGSRLKEKMDKKRRSIYSKNSRAKHSTVTDAPLNSDL